jgi:hypothetical protein
MLGCQALTAKRLYAVRSMAYKRLLNYAVWHNFCNWGLYDSPRRRASRTKMFNGHPVRRDKSVAKKMFNGHQNV